MNRSAAMQLLAAALLAGSGCYEAPGALPDGEALQLAVSPASATADGRETVEVAVTVKPETPASSVITLETSSGVLNPDADPESAEARKLDVKNPGTGIIRRTLRVGTTPGPVFITARAGDFQETREIELEASLPDRVVLTATPGKVTADGTTAIDVRAALYTEEIGGRVSQGARVLLGACCAAMDTGMPAECDTSGVLTLPALKELTQGQEIAVQATPLRIEGGDPWKLILVAQVWEEGHESLGCAAEEGAVRDQVPITLTPVPAAPAAPP